MSAFKNCSVVPIYKDIIIDRENQFFDYLKQNLDKPYRRKGIVVVFLLFQIILSTVRV